MSAKPIRDLVSEEGDFQESLDPFATLNELEAEYMSLLNEDMIDPDLRGDEFFHESSISDEDSISIEADPTDPSSLISEAESDVSTLLLPAQESLESVTCAKGSDELSYSPSDRWKAGTIFLRGDIVDRYMSNIVARNEEYYAEAVMGKKNLRQHLFGRLIRILKDFVADFVKDSSMERQSRAIDQVEAFLKGNYRASEEHFVKRT